MNNLFDMLTKAGYEVSSIGSDVLPCTLRLGDEPIGFLLDNLSLRLLPDREEERGRLQPILSFSTENQGIEQEQGEYVLSRYQNVALTATFDYDSCHPVYNIYSEDKDKNRTLLNSSEEKAAAAKDFASRSGLVSGDIPEPIPDVGRIDRFIDAAQAKGYQIRESRETTHRAYDITDKDGREVGYIGNNNRVTITSENSHVKHTLTNAYLDSSSNAVLLPGFFERLKENLKKIGMALKIVFTPKGRHYAIHNSDHQEIASVGEQTHTVMYTDLATEAEKAKIDALVEGLRREEAQKGNESKNIELEKAESIPIVPTVSAEEIKNVTNAILSDRASAETFLNTILTNQAFNSLLNQKLAEVQRANTPEEESISAAKQHSAQAKETTIPTEKVSSTQEKTTPATMEYPAAEKMREEFDRDYSYLQTLFGFNQEKYDELRVDMTARFGTADPKEFQALLDTGKFDGTSKLQGRLDASRRVAEMKNAARQTEKTQEKERA
ncbi:MAG TPA: hypothetical protein VHP31_00140 [Caproicibacter sp.]|nr:hypothetical protein [Caproicibacter sp.]